MFASGYGLLCTAELTEEVVATEGATAIGVWTTAADEVVATDGVATTAGVETTAAAEELTPTAGAGTAAAVVPQDIICNIVIVISCVTVSAIGVMVTVGAAPVPKTVVVTNDNCSLIGPHLSLLIPITSWDEPRC